MKTIRKLSGLEFRLLKQCTQGQGVLMQTTWKPAKVLRELGLVKKDRFGMYHATGEGLTVLGIDDYGHE